jgi:Na+/phosphate symporter
MGDYEIKLNLSIRNKYEDISEDIFIDSEGVIPEGESTSIDAVEQVLLNVHKDSIKKTITKYLGDISKKKLNLSEKVLEEKL